MRIVRPSQERRAGSGAKRSNQTEVKAKQFVEHVIEELPDSKVESGNLEPAKKVRRKRRSQGQSSTDAKRARAKPTGKGQTRSFEAPATPLSSRVSANSKVPKPQNKDDKDSALSAAAEPTAFSDGRKRRRSEFSKLSFFNSKIDEKERSNSSAEDIAVGGSNDDSLQIFEPNDDRQLEFNRLMVSGMRFLSMREHSVKEITNKLLSKAELSEVAYAVVDELLENKYLSDERFAESFVRSRANKGVGPIKIRAELKNKGVSSQMITDALDETSAIWFDIAQEQHIKKYGNASLKDYSDWTKRARFLQGRGFTMDHIQLTLPKLEFD